MKFNILQFALNYLAKQDSYGKVSIQLNFHFSAFPGMLIYLGCIRKENLSFLRNIFPSGLLILFKNNKNIRKYSNIWIWHICFKNILNFVFNYLLKLFSSHRLTCWINLFWKIFFFNGSIHNNKYNFYLKAFFILFYDIY